MGLLKCRKGDSVTLCIPLCICRQTLAWISSEISTKLLGMPTHLDRSSLTAAGLYLMRLVSQMSGIDFQTPLCVFRRQLTSLSSFVQLLTGVHLPTSGRVDISSPNPLSGFAPKTDKGIVCLADNIHSVTGAKGLGQSFGLFLLPLYFIQSYYYNDLHSLLCTTDCRSWNASNFVHISLLTVSLGTR